MAKFLIDQSGRMEYDPIIMKQTLDQMYRVEQPVSQFSNLLTGLGQGTLSNINQLAYLSRSIFGDEYGDDTNEWANKKLAAIEPTSYDTSNASLLDYIPFVSNMYSSGEFARQAGNLVGQLAPDITAAVVTGGTSLMASGASLTTRAAAIGLTKEAAKAMVKKEGYTKALETIAREEVAKGITPGIVASTISGARAGFEGLPTIAKAIIGSAPMDIVQAGKSAGGVYGEMTEKGYSRSDAQTGALESFGGNLVLNTVANTAHIMGAMAAFGKNTVKATEGATNVAKQSTDNVIAGMEKNPVLQTLKNITESTPGKIASIPAMMAFGGYEESIADDIDRAAMTGNAFSPTLNPMKFDPQQVQSFAGGAMLGGAMRTTGVVGGALRNRAEQQKTVQELAKQNAQQATEAARLAAAQQQAKVAAQEAVKVAAVPITQTNTVTQPIDIITEAKKLLSDHNFAGTPSMKDGEESKLSHPLFTALGDAVRTGDEKNVKAVLDQIKGQQANPVAPEQKTPLQIRAEYETIQREQEKRKQQLQKTDAELAPIAQERGLSVKEYRTLLQTNLNSNQQRLKDLHQKINSPEFQKAEEEAKKKASEEDKPGQSANERANAILIEADEAGYELSDSEKRAIDNLQTDWYDSIRFNINEYKLAKSNNPQQPKQFTPQEKRTITSAAKNFIKNNPNHPKASELEQAVSGKSKDYDKIESLLAAVNKQETNTQPSTDQVVGEHIPTPDDSEAPAGASLKGFKVGDTLGASFFGHVPKWTITDKTLGEVVKPIAHKTKEVAVKVMSYAKHLFEKGITKAKDFMASMRKALGDMWETTKHHAANAYNFYKKYLSGQGGYIRLGSAGDFVARQIKSVDGKKDFIAIMSEDSDTLDRKKIVAYQVPGNDKSFAMTTHGGEIKADPTMMRRLIKQFTPKTQAAANQTSSVTQTTPSQPTIDKEKVHSHGVVKIISGGQSGADLAGLDAALDLGIPTGGTAAAGYQRESDSGKKFKDLQLRDKYGLKEGKTEQRVAKDGTVYDDVYHQRTIANAQEADGTIWFGDETSPGGRVTLSKTAQNGKPKPLVNPKSAQEIINWLKENGIKTVNIAGNRENSNNGIYKNTKEMLIEAFTTEYKDTSKPIFKVRNLDGSVSTFNNYKEALAHRNKEFGVTGSDAVRLTTSYAPQKAVEAANKVQTEIDTKMKELNLKDPMLQRFKRMLQVASSIVDEYMVILDSKTPNIIRKQKEKELKLKNGIQRMIAIQKYLKDKYNNHPEITKLNEIMKLEEKKLAIITNSGDIIMSDNKGTILTEQDKLDFASQGKDNYVRKYRTLKDQVEVVREGEKAQTDMTEFFDRIEEEYGEDALSSGTIAIDSDRQDAQQKAIHELTKLAAEGQNINKSYVISALMKDPTNETLRTNLLKSFIGKIIEKAVKLDVTDNGKPKHTMDFVQDGITMFSELVNHYFDKKPLTTIGQIRSDGQFTPMVTDGKTFFQSFPQIISQMNSLVGKYSDMGDERIAKNAKLVADARRELTSILDRVPTDAEVKAYYVDTQSKKDRSVAEANGRLDRFDKEINRNLHANNFDRGMAELSRRTLATVTDRADTIEGDVNKDGDKFDPTGEKRDARKQLHQQVYDPLMVNQLPEQMKKVIDIFNNNLDKFTDEEVGLFDSYIDGSKDPLDSIDKMPQAMQQKLYDIFKGEFKEEYSPTVNQQKDAVENPVNKLSAKTEYVSAETLSESERALAKKGELPGYVYVGQGSQFASPFQPIVTKNDDGKPIVTPANAKKVADSFAQLLKLNMTTQHGRRAIRELAKEAGKTVAEMLKIRKDILSGLKNLIGNRIVTNSKYLPNSATVLTEIARKLEYGKVKFIEIQEANVNEQGVGGLPKTGDGASVDFGKRKTSLRSGDMSAEGGETVRGSGVSGRNEELHFSTRIIGFSPEETKTLTEIITEHPHVEKYMNEKTDMKIVKGTEGYFANMPDTPAIWRNGDTVINPNHPLNKVAIQHELSHDAYNRGYVPEQVVVKSHNTLNTRGEQMLSSILSTKNGKGYIDALKSMIIQSLDNERDAINFAKKIWDNNDVDFASKLSKALGVEINGNIPSLMYHLVESMDKLDGKNKKMFRDYMLDEYLAHHIPLIMDHATVKEIFGHSNLKTYIPDSSQYADVSRHIMKNALRYMYQKIMDNEKARDYLGIADDDVKVYERIKNGEMGLWDQWFASVSNVVRRHPALAPIYRAAFHAAGIQERLTKSFNAKYDKIYDSLTQSERDDVRWIRMQTDYMKRELVDTVQLSTGKYKDKTLVLSIFDSKQIFGVKKDALEYIKNTSKQNYLNTHLEWDGDKSQWVAYGWHGSNKVFSSASAAHSFKKSYYNDVVAQLGYSQKVGKAVKDIRAIYDTMHRLVTSVNTLTGKPAPKYAKAYLPHYFEDFIIYVDDQGVDIDGKGGSFEHIDDAIREANKLKRANPTSEVKVKARSLPKGHSNLMNEPSFAETIMQDGALDIMNAASIGQNEFNEWANLRYSKNNMIEDILKNNLMKTFDVSQLSNLLTSAGISQDAIAHSGLIDFAARQGSVTTEQLLNKMKDVGGQHRGNTFMKNRKNVIGWSQDIEKVDRKYMNSIARYIAMEPFMYNATRYYERYNSDEMSKEKEVQSVVRFSDTPPTDIARYMKELINDTNGKPTGAEEIINKLLTNNKVMYNLIGQHLGARPGAKLSNIITQSMTVAKLGLNPASALLQAGQILNINAKLDHDSDGIMKYAGFGKWTHEGFTRALNVMRGKGSLTDLKILKAAGVDITMGMHNETSYASSGIFEGKIGKVLKATLVPFTFADRLVKATAALGHFHKMQSQNPGMSNKELYLRAREFMIQTNFDYGPVDASNLHRRTGPIGQVILQFKKYPMKQLEFVFDGLEDASGNHGFKGMFGREGKLFWPSYLLWAGVMGIPGLALIKSLAGTMTGADSEEKMKRMLMAAAGNDWLLQAAAKQIMYGAPSYTLGIDISKRIGMADLIPTSADGFTGPMLSTMYNTFKIFVQHPMNIDTAMEMTRSVSPGVGNMMRAIAGYSVSPNNRERTKIEYTPGERIAKGLGFAPARESILTDQANIIAKENIEITKEKQYAIDKYITNKTEANLKKVRELGITNEQLKNEIKRRGQNSVKRAIDSTPKKYLQDRKSILAFN